MTVPYYMANKIFDHQCDVTFAELDVPVEKSKEKTESNAIGNCEYCGSLVFNTDKFCNGCGASISFSLHGAKKMTCEEVFQVIEKDDVESLDMDEVSAYFDKYITNPLKKFAQTEKYPGPSEPGIFFV
jgi:hypothetical protein